MDAKEIDLDQWPWILPIPPCRLFEMASLTTPTSPLVTATITISPFSLAIL